MNSESWGGWAGCPPGARRRLEGILIWASEGYLETCCRAPSLPFLSPGDELFSRCPCDFSLFAHGHPCAHPQSLPAKAFDPPSGPVMVAHTGLLSPCHLGSQKAPRALAPAAAGSAAPTRAAGRVAPLQVPGPSQAPSTRPLELSQARQGPPTPDLQHVSALRKGPGSPLGRSG